MKQTRWFRGAASAACLLGLGLAVKTAHAESHLAGSDYISRPLVLPKGVLRIDGGPRRPYDGGQVMPGGQLQVFVNDGQDVALLAPGAAYGVIDNLELGAVWPLVLSPDLDTEGIEAQMRHGVLSLRIPKREQAKPRRIEVRAG